MPKTINYKNYNITREDNGAVSVVKDGEPQSNAKAALKEVASVAGFQVEDKWNTYQIGAKLINYLEDNNLVPKSKNIEKIVEGTSSEIANAKVRVYGKAQNRTVLGIAHAYMVMYPQATLEDLRKAFPNELNPAKNVDELFVYATKPAERGEWRGYFDLPEELLTMGDGKKVQLAGMWTKESFEKAVFHAKQYGIIVADFEKAKGGGKKGGFRLEDLNGYVPPVPAQKKSLWWLWLIIILLLAGLAAFFAFKPKEVVEVEKIVEEEKIVYVDRVEEIEKNFNAATFIQGKADLSDDAKFVLHDLEQLMQKHPELKLKLVGHTSSEGDATFNQKLSEARAQAAVDFLVGRGVDASRLSAEGKGSSEPIDENNPEANRKQFDG